MNKFTNLLPLVLLVLAPTAFANSNTQVSSKSIETSSFAKAIKPDRISHFTEITGPSLSGDSRPNNVDGSENTDGMQIWNQVSFQWKINDNYRWVFNPRFTANIGQAKTGDERHSTDTDLNSWVTGIQATWYQNGKLKISGGINSVFGILSDTDEQRELVMNPGGFQTIRYTLNEKVNFGTWFWMRYRYYRNAPDKSKFPTFVSPFVNYSVNDKLGYSAFYQVNGKFTEIDSAEWDADDHMNFAVSYSISKNLSIMPIVRLFRKTDFELSEGNLMMWVSGSFM